MARNFFSETSGLIRKHYWFLLALSWITGLIFGVMLFLCDSHFFAVLMRGAADCSVSIVGMFHTVLLPFLFSALAVVLFGSVSLLPICWFKAFFFSCVSLGIWFSYGCTGRLSVLLLMFADVGTTVLLYILWLRLLSGKYRSLTADTFLFCILSIAWGIVNYCIISPFLVSLIEI